MINTEIVRRPCPNPSRVLVVEEWCDESRDVVVCEIETDEAGAAALRAEGGFGTFRVLADAPIV